MPRLSEGLQRLVRKKLYEQPEDGIADFYGDDVCALPGEGSRRLRIAPNLPLAGEGISGCSQLWELMVAIGTKHPEQDTTCSFVSLSQPASAGGAGLSKDQLAIAAYLEFLALCSLAVDPKRLKVHPLAIAMNSTLGNRLAIFEALCKRFSSLSSRSERDRYPNIAFFYNVCVGAYLMAEHHLKSAGHQWSDLPSSDFPTVVIAPGSTTEDLESSMFQMSGWSQDSDAEWRSFFSARVINQLLFRVEHRSERPWFPLWALGAKTRRYWPKKEQTTAQPEWVLSVALPSKEIGLSCYSTKYFQMGRPQSRAAYPRNHSPLALLVAAMAADRFLGRSDRLSPGLGPAPGPIGSPPGVGEIAMARDFVEASRIGYERVAAANLGRPSRRFAAAQIEADVARATGWVLPLPDAARDETDAVIVVRVPLTGRNALPAAVVQQWQQHMPGCAVRFQIGGVELGPFRAEVDVWDAPSSAQGAPVDALELEIVPLLPPEASAQVEQAFWAKPNSAIQTQVWLVDIALEGEPMAPMLAVILRS
jgi:hypothetical protein